MYQLTGEHFVPYCLRHFYASQSIYNGVPEDVIADNMGITKIRLNRSYKHCFMRLRTKKISTPRYPPGSRSLLKWFIITASTAIALRPSISGL